MTHPVVLAAAVKLCTENAGAGYDTESAQIKHKHKLVDYRHTRHLLGAHSSHHDVVQQTYEVRNAVLNHNGQHNSKDHKIKCLIAQILFLKIFHVSLPFYSAADLLFLPVSFMQHLRCLFYAAQLRFFHIGLHKLQKAL